jgi:UDP-N-acetylglucosamine acyltransferase
MIDEKAVISPTAKIAKNVSIGPFSVIGPEVEIGSGTSIDSHVVIQGKTKIGKDNKIFCFCSIGAPPQSIKYANEPTSVEIGDGNTIREYCSINKGSTVPGYGVTKLGDNNFIMAYSHIAHDCTIGNGNIFANEATLAGHVVIGNFVGLGGSVKILQFSRLADYCFITGATNISKDVPPFLLVSGLHGEVKPYGLNLVGLKRRGFSAETILNLKRAYSIIYRQGLTIPDAIKALKEMLVVCPEVQGFIDVLQKNKRGVVR